MAELKQYFAQSGRQVVLTPMSIANTDGAAIGQGVSQLGEALDVLAQREETFWVQKQMVSADKYARDLWNEQTTNAQNGAGGFREGYMSGLESYYEQIREGAPSGRARRALESEILTHRNNADSQAHGFQTQEQYEFRKHTILQETDNLASDLAIAPGVAPWNPAGSMRTAPGLPAPFSSEDGFFSSGVADDVGGLHLPNNIDAFSSKYYSPMDFADGEHMGDRSGAVVVHKQVLGALDWVTDQFGLGKLQINSGFRSGASNVKRAESGPHGPHTKGKSLDIQVRHLPQGEKDRLYSLFKAAGANSFGFGEGVLHVEWRDQPASWTYGSAKPYGLIPVASPNARDSVASVIPKSSSGDMASLRPFQSWERRDNGNGSHSSEITTTFQDESGRWVNAPSLWRNADGWVELDEDKQRAAVQEYERTSGSAFPRFDTLEEAEKAAQTRSEGGGAAVGAHSYNQYPYLNAVALTARAETGSGDLASASLSIANEANGTISVGALGLNSDGLLPAFLKANGEAMGVTASPGSPEFKAQWEAAVRKDPEGAIGRQLAFHESHVIRPAKATMQAVGASGVVNDPRAVSLTSDLIIQYGAEIARKHIAAGKGAANAEAFVAAVTASTKASLEQDFRTTIGADPSTRKGLLNRIDQRAATAMAAGPGGAIASGNVPLYSGPLPSIEDMPEFANRFRRIEGMIETIGGTPAQRRAVRDTLRSNVVGAWLSRVSELNPSAAMAVLHSGKYADELSIGDVSAISKGAKATYDQYEAQIRQNQKELIEGLKAETTQLISDEIASISATGNGIGKLSDAHLAVASDKEKDELAFAQFSFITNRQIASANLDELAGILEEHRPEGEGFADEQRRYAHVQEQIQKRIELQKNDPAGMVLSMSPELNQRWKEAVANSDVDAIGSTIRSIRAAQERMGVPADQTRAMPQTSMASFEAMLSKAEDPEQAFTNVQQLVSTFGPEAAQIVAEMEAAGLQRGWRDVVELMDTGKTLAAKSLTRVVHAGEFGADVELGVRLAKAGRPDVARKVFDGRLRRKELPGLLPTGKDEDLDVGVKQAIGDHMGNAFGTDGSMFNAVREAALSVYGADVPFGASFDATEITKAIDLVTGGILEHNSDGVTGQFVAPTPGMTQQQFNDALWTLDDTALEGAFVGYAYEDMPLTRSDLARVQLQSAGAGKYFVNWPGAGLARTKDGLPFVLDFHNSVQFSRDRQLQKQLEPLVGKSVTDPQADNRQQEQSQLDADLAAMRDQQAQIQGSGDNR